MTLNQTNVNITATTGQTLTIAQILAGIITRTGPSGGFQDMLPDTADILAAVGAGTSPWLVEYINASGQTATIARGDTNTTIVSGAGMLSATTIATHQKCELLFTPGGTPNAPTLTVTMLYRTTLV